MTARKGQGRPIGKRVIEAMEILECMGEATYTEVWALMEDVTDSRNADKYLTRAVAYGLAERLDGRPVKYRVMPNWREYLMAPAAPEREPVGPRPVSSVWELGMRASEVTA